MIRKKLFFVLFVLFPALLFGQKTDSIRYPKLKVTEILVSNYEHAFEAGTNQFSVKNSRVDAVGNLTGNISYRGQLTLKDNGNFNVLDLSATFMPVQGLSLTFGQTAIPLFNPYVAGPSSMMFATRPYIGDYFLSTRDVGLSGKYQFYAGIMPVSVELGLFNGNTINKSEWRKGKNMSYGARLQLGTMKGARATVKFYDYPNSEELHYFFYGADVRYEGDNWKIETEVINRDNRKDEKDDLLSYYVQGVYGFPLKKSWIFKNVLPAVRWDALKKGHEESGMDVNRLTVGVGFGLTQKYFSSLLRLNYERCFVNREIDILGNEKDSDKLIVGLILVL